MMSLLRCITKATYEELLNENSNCRLYYNIVGKIGIITLCIISCKINLMAKIFYIMINRILKRSVKLDRILVQGNLSTVFYIFLFVLSIPIIFYLFCQYWDS